MSQPIALIRPRVAQHLPKKPTAEARGQSTVQPRPGMVRPPPGDHRP